ncbi:MAG: HD domain-containing protein [Christensenellaceae bacterium]|jgi:5'-deoxynucleotidase YfbR-like HD superfamily hydrolase|nr:HD domain-containing protein [Christensenellaceae bacterium]
MKDIKNAIEFYYAATGLKELLRQGAVQWKVKRKRLEDVADHIFGTQILAIALKNNLNINIDLGYVLEMLTIHELEELKIGDLTYFTGKNITKEQKTQRGAEFVSNLLSKLTNKEYYQKMIDDFNCGNTLEAKFAKACDKFENVLEFKKYADAGQVNLSHGSAEMLADKTIQKYLKEGITSLEDIWFIYHSPSFESFGLTREVWKKTIKPIDTKGK